MQLSRRECRTGERAPANLPAGDREFEADLDHEEGWYACAQCGERLAHESWVLSSAASGPLVFANPHGRFFQLLLLRCSRGVVFDHHATAEHTWFSGYTWRVGVCGSCTTHVGWRFEAQIPGAEPPEFVAVSQAAVRFVRGLGPS